MGDTHYYCPAHYQEISERWGGHPERAYPGDKIEVHASKCEYLGCLYGAPSYCPHCRKPVRPNDLVVL